MARKKNTSSVVDMPMLPFADFDDEPYEDSSPAVTEARAEVHSDSLDKTESKQPALERIRERSSRKRLKVTFPDGTMFNDNSATRTMIDTIEYIGVEKVAALNMENCHVPLLSKGIVPRYKEWTKPMNDGWYLMAQSDTAQKHLQLLSIKNQLGLEFDVESVDDCITAKDVNRRKRTKQELIVKLDNGITLSSIKHVDLFVQVVKHIGIEKVFTSNIKISSKPIITTTRQYNRQVELSHARWLTIPATIKDKYKVIIMLASMARLKFEVSIK